MASARFEPANLGTKGQHATPRPLKPLDSKELGDGSMLHVPSPGLAKLRHVAFAAVPIFISLAQPLSIYRGCQKMYTHFKKGKKLY
jgi:hypothetical protein